MELAKSQFYKIFIDSPSAMGVSTLEEGRLIDVNESFLDFFEYAREEVIGRTSFELKIWIDRQDRDKVIKELRNSNLVHNVEAKLRTKTGVIKDVLICVRNVPYLGLRNSVILFMFQDISKLKHAQEALRLSQKTLKEQNIILEQKNAALREMVSLVEVEKNKIKRDVVANVALLLPIIEKVNMKKHPQKNFLNVIKNGLENIVSSFGNVITQQSFKLTSREIEISNMIKNGLTTKEIARSLLISSQTIEKHRKNIRKKMGISFSDVNLATFLKTIN